MDYTVIWAAIGAVGSVAAAGIAAWAARQSKSSSEKANLAAGTLAAIERERRRDELTPDFDVILTAPGPDADTATLYVELKPSRLDRLDAVTITILDETGSDHWGRGLPQGVTQDQAEAFVWGPWEFNTGAAEQVVSNCTTRARAYSVTTGKNWDVLSMQHTRPGSWMAPTSPASWRRRHKGRPVRLVFTCLREGEQWTVVREVTAAIEKKAAVRFIE